MEQFNSLTLRSLTSGWSNHSFQNAIERVTSEGFRCENESSLHGGYIYQAKDIDHLNGIWIYRGGLKLLSPDEVLEYVDEGTLEAQEPDYRYDKTVAALVLEIGYGELFMEVARVQHDPDLDILDNEGRLVFSKPFISNEREGRVLAKDIVTGALEYLVEAGFMPMYGYDELHLSSSIASRIVIPQLANSMVVEEVPCSEAVY